MNEISESKTTVVRKSPQIDANFIKRHPTRARHLIEDPELRFLVDCYALNRKDEHAAAKSWGWVEEALRRG